MENGAFGVHEFFAFAEDAGRDAEAGFHFRKVVSGGVAFDLHAVDFQVGLLVDSIACGSRMTAGLIQQCVGPLRVVRKKQQAFAGGVEAAHRRYVRYGLAGKHLGVLFAEQVHHGLAALLVACGGYDSAGLVHGKVDEIACGDGSAVDEDFVVFVGGRFGVAHRLAPENYVAFAYQLFGLAAATIAAFGNHAGNAVGALLWGLAVIECHGALQACGKVFRSAHC